MTRHRRPKNISLAEKRAALEALKVRLATLQAQQANGTLPTNTCRCNDPAYRMEIETRFKDLVRKRLRRRLERNRAKREAAQ